MGMRRPYAYLTGGLPVGAGDWVEVPFGREDAPRCGQVDSVTDCTRSEAPWPPEQTKTVLRAAGAPASEGTTELTAPEKKPFPFGKLIAAVLAVAVIAGIILAVSNCGI